MVRRVFVAPVDVVMARRVAEVRPALEAVERGLLRGLDAAGWLTYEAAPAFDPAFRVRPGARMPLLWFGLFEPEGTARSGASSLPPPSPPDADSLRTTWALEPDRAAWDAAVDRVRSALEEGRSYQVNLTGRIRGRLGVDSSGLQTLYEVLRRAQGRGWHALLETEDHAVLSASPELFFHVDGRDVVTRPMKGTRPRGRWEEEDLQRGRELVGSEKELAENRMIVDLVRNDLGRVCQIGTVRAPRLMDVERYPTVLQMTSTVTGRLRPDVGLTGILDALFPCGSVTGAPKVATTGIIADLEGSPREVYCGAVGFAEGATGRATFSVPIRTLWIDRRSGVATYGAGCGITWDSNPGAEYDELRAKAAVLRADVPDFDLLETLRVEDGRVLRLERHLARLASSCRYFGRPFPEAEVRAALADAARRRTGRRRLRLTLSAGGRVAVDERPLTWVGAPGPGAGKEESREVVLSSEPVDDRDPFLFHKTTRRAVYERRAAAHPDAWDVLLVNGAGRVTEFCRGNLVADVGGRRVTPPRRDGLLAGCFRAELLEAGTVEEASLTPADLAGARRLWLVNSVREWVEVRLRRS